jgi:hypothetical protein
MDPRRAIFPLVRVRRAPRMFQTWIASEFRRLHRSMSEENSINGHW